MAGQLETNRFYEFGPYRLDRHARVLLRDGAIVPLTPKVLDTLLALVESRNGVVSKDELLRLVWPDSFVEESNLAQNISVLRKALGQSPDQVTYIETIPKRGYRFVPEVRSAPAVEQPKADSSYPAVVPPMTAPPSLVPARRVRIMTLTAVAASIFMFPAGGDRLREIQREQRLRRYFFRPFAPMLCQLPARSNASAARYSVDSCQCLATSISPIGRSPSPNPHGIDIAG